MSMTASDLQSLNDVVNNLRKAWEGMTREQRNMSMTVGYKFNDYFKYGVFMDMISYATIIILIPLFYSLTM